MKSTKIIIKTKSKIYPIYFGDKILGSIGRIIKKKIPSIKKIVIIADNKIPPFFLKKLIFSLKKYNTKIYKITANEKSKSFRTANKLIERILKDNLNRSDCIVSFGGGVVSDLSSFISSLVKRGIKFVNIPTTLLAQVDASIGGKTGVNSFQGKNLIGTFYQPDFILIDTSLLKSLPQREMICGYGEILKHSLILDKKFFFWLNKNAKKMIYKKNKILLKYAIIKSCKIKSLVINKDEKEKDLRMLLNFGHTFAHGFEGARNFSKKISHGEAVLLGMIMASKLSFNKKILSLQHLNLIKNHYIKLNLPMNIKRKFKKNEINKILNFMKKDKKNIDKKINLILLKKIGMATKPNNYKVNENELKKFFLKEFV